MKKSTLIELMPLLRARLDEPTLAALAAEGRQMSNAAAVAYALEEARDYTSQVPNASPAR